MPPLWLTVPARPGQLAGVRRALREWMVQAGIGEYDAGCVQIAAGEAASNAVEHAYHGADEAGLLRLTARLESGGADGVLHVQVVDSGRWRPPGVHTEQRGRGLALMQSTMDTVELEHGSGTTVTMRLALGRQEPAQPAGA